MKRGQTKRDYEKKTSQSERHESVCERERERDRERERERVRRGGGGDTSGQLICGILRS